MQKLGLWLSRQIDKNIIPLSMFGAPVILLIILIISLVFSKI